MYYILNSKSEYFEFSFLLIKALLNEKIIVLIHSVLKKMCCAVYCLTWICFQLRKVVIN